MKKGDSFCLNYYDERTLHVLLGKGYKVEAYNRYFKLMETSEHAFASTYPINKIIITTDEAEGEYSAIPLQVELLNYQISYSIKIVLQNNWTDTVKISRNDNLVSGDLIVVYNNEKSHVSTSGAVRYFDFDRNMYQSDSLSLDADYIYFCGDFMTSATMMSSSFTASANSLTYNPYLPEQVLTNLAPFQLFTKEEPDDNKLSTGAIVGIAIACVVVLIAIVVGAIFGVRYFLHRTGSNAETAENTEPQIQA